VGKKRKILERLELVYVMGNSALDSIKSLDEDIRTL